MKFTIELTDNTIKFILPSGAYTCIQKDAKQFWHLVFGYMEDIKRYIRAWKEGNL